MKPYGPGVPLAAGLVAVCPVVVLAAAWEPGGGRRLPAAHYLIAAAAAERSFGVLHLDGHFDTLASVLGFVSVRLDHA